MIGGKLAARAILELLASGDLSERACRVYHDRWMTAFGRDFRFSSVGARMIHRVPLLLDAANVVAQRKGDAFMAEFGAAMTGVKPKSVFLSPGMAVPMTVEIARQIARRALRRRRGAEGGAYALRAVEGSSRPTAFPNSCLIDARVEASTVAFTPSRG